MVIEPSPRRSPFLRWFGLGVIAVSMAGFLIQWAVTPAPSTRTETNTYNDGSSYVYESTTEHLSDYNYFYWFIPMGAGLLFFVFGKIPIWKEQEPGDGSKDKGEVMVDLPEKWDEKEISAGIELVRRDKGLVGHYIQQIITRFVDGQDARTMESRTAFLEKQKKMLEVGLETVRLKRQIMRANREEDNNDRKVEHERSALDSEASLHGLKTDLEREKILTEIERAKHERASIGKEPPAPSKQTNGADQRDRERSRLKSRMNEIREEIRITEANPNLEEEQKQRFVNMLEDRIAGLEAEYAKLL